MDSFSPRPLAAPGVCNGDKELFHIAWQTKSSRRRTPSFSEGFVVMCHLKRNEHVWSLSLSYQNSTEYTPG
jgi:hypothetical protein